MIAISAAVALGPAMDTARSPESRVKVKLMTRTVRQTKAASNILRTRNKRIRNSYHWMAGACKLEMQELKATNLDVPHFSAFALPVRPSLRQRAFSFLRRQSDPAK